MTITAPHLFALGIANLVILAVMLIRAHVINKRERENERIRAGANPLASPTLTNPKRGRQTA